MKKKSKIRILTIDGGGIRGILPAFFLSALEKKLQERKGKEVQLYEYFDLVAGSSIGAILACAYLCPINTVMKKSSRFTGQKVINLLKDNGGNLFNSNWVKTLLSGGGILDEKYDAFNLEQLLENEFQDVQLSHLLKPCLITAYDMEERQAVLFTSYNAISKNKDFYIKDVARATSAAPTYFEPAKINTLNGIPYTLIDGGLYANNPTLCAYSEAKKIEFSKVLKNPNKVDFPEERDMIIISVGTGSIKEKYDYYEYKDKGVLSWAKPVIDILMSSNSETTNYHVAQIFREIHKKSDAKQYFRVEPHLYSAVSKMDNASPENIKNLIIAGKKFVIDNDELIEELVDLLIDND